MSNLQSIQYCGRFGILLALSAFALGFLSVIIADKEGQTLPQVVSAQAPIYPRILQAAHLEGVVRLRVTTDGKRALSVDSISGPAMLVQAATENVKTWEFLEHSAMTFETTFTYSLLESSCDKGCNCYSLEEPSVLLRLPKEADIKAQEIIDCDPVVMDED